MTVAPSIRLAFVFIIAVFSVPAGGTVVAKHVGVETSRRL